LLALEKHLQPGDHVLDLGTGSGILAIAAVKLGATSCLAYDIDPVAVESARANAEANGVHEVVRVARGSLAEALDFKRKNLKGGFDLALVNILAKIIVELCGQGLSDAVKPGGRAVFAGLIDTQEAEVREALERIGFRVVERTQGKDWVGLVCQKTA
jgi:ribosomal protein L11 methyltransferase